MTPRERAEIIQKKLEAEDDKLWHPRLFFDEAGNEIEQAIIAAVEEERKRCAQIIHEVYLAWVDGDWAPGEAFESAKEKIRFGGKK